MRVMMNRPTTDQTVGNMRTGIVVGAIQNAEMWIMSLQMSNSLTSKSTEAKKRKVDHPQYYGAEWRISKPRRERTRTSPRSWPSFIFLSVVAGRIGGTFGDPIVVVQYVLFTSIRYPRTSARIGSPNDQELIYCSFRLLALTLTVALPRNGVVPSFLTTVDCGCPVISRRSSDARCPVSGVRLLLGLVG